MQPTLRLRGPTAPPRLPRAAAWLGRCGLAAVAVPLLAALERPAWLPLPPRGAAWLQGRRGLAAVAPPLAAALALPRARAGVPAARGDAAPIIVDTDCGLDDLATLALAAVTPAELRLVTTVHGLAPPGVGHLLARRFLDALDLGGVPVVAGAENPPAYTANRRKAAWEEGYGEHLAESTAALGMEPVTAEQARPAAGSAAAAADAIVQAARGNASVVLALGALTNLACAAERHPVDFARCVRRVVFIGDSDPSHVSYNMRLDPDALRTVLRSGVELVLVGGSCYTTPQWVGELFRGGEAPAGPSSAAARALHTLGSTARYSLCYDPLALLFHLHEDAFDFDTVPIPVRVTRGADWRFERCDDAQRDGYALEPRGMRREMYAAFLRSAGAIGAGGRR